MSTQCWEQCFQSLATNANLPVLQEIHKTGNDLRRMRDVNTANGVVYLLDSTLASLCRSSSSSSSSESFENELKNENATAIWQLQLQTMAIFSAMIGNARFFPVQFNENAAWSCNTYSCLDCCQMFTLVNSNLLTPVQINSTSCKDGLLEPACRLGFHGLVNYTCSMTPGFTVYNSTNMTVAILNSNVHAHVHKRGNYRDYSPCHTYFRYRYAVGLHRANHDDLERFQSRDDLHNYMGDNLLYQTVVNSLYSCINTKCCATASTITTPTVCKIAYGDAGESLTQISSINPIG